MYGNGPGGYGGDQQNSWSSGMGGVPAIPDRPVGERREPGLVFLFSLFTCGIYYLWWVAKVSEETQRFLNEPDTSPTLEVILFLITGGLYGIYWDYKMGKKIARIQEAVGLPPTDNSILYVILDLFFATSLFTTLFQQGHLNDAWNRVGVAVQRAR